MRLAVTKQRFRNCLLGTVLCACAAVLFAYVSTWSAAALFAGLAIVMTGFTLQAARRYGAARLICENPLLDVGVASVTEQDGTNVTGGSMNVVVSGFADRLWDGCEQR